ncbi:MULTISPECIES: lipid kinase YegS [Pseudomonas]|uniref:Probable lipid kinase YegS-like n=1 Tax=Pseudomonas cichorii TaxID=36746 RepID=A0A3M4VIF1_PSECI|nr:MULTISPECIES: lipid kinase YegS [Pseudomonas]AHF68351.1 lipid kinase [Pseudomonas cichorii JBC1]QVE15370.1 lipid kinase YegS [Pseudomonas cichorii]RMR51620.1 putative lipid kinase YegS-like [Pseudomonas cichorii]SDO20354.1 lipid kinase YegS [Pseudomonas cichorii]GFM76081.1 putative lipid kinase YegS-like protein [Pseudomonas cichorii]
MTKRRAILILHGKQSLNEDVRNAVLEKRKQGWDLDVRLTWEGGDAQRLVTEALAAGHRHIIAGGGDGTVRDIAEALAQARTNSSMVILPLGTANDFARAAGVPLEVADALDLLDVEPRAVDLGEVGGKLFLNMATGGFGSQVTANTSEDLKKVLGGAAYLFTGLSRFSELHAAHGELVGPDFHWRGNLLALGIGNGRQAGGGHVLCPEAMVDDGMLDISILPAPQEVVGTLKSLLEGGLGIDNMFVRARLPWVELKSAQGLDINLDGEPLSGENLRFVARPAALQVHLPKNSPVLGAVQALNRPD